MWRKNVMISIPVKYYQKESRVFWEKKRVAFNRSVYIKSKICQRSLLLLWLKGFSLPAFFNHLWKGILWIFNPPPPISKTAKRNRLFTYCKMLRSFLKSSLSALLKNWQDCNSKLKQAHDLWGRYIDSAHKTIRRVVTPRWNNYVDDL